MQISILDAIINAGANLHINNQIQPDTACALAALAKQKNVHLTVNCKGYTPDNLITIAEAGGKNVTLIV